MDAAGKSVDIVTQAQADIGFSPSILRGAGIAFTEPYVLIEGAYLVRQDSPLRANEEVDRAGLRVAVGKGSAYDLYLTRELKAAEIVRARPRPPWSTPSWNKAGRGRRRAPAARRRGRHAGLRLLPGRFMVIRQAMAAQGLSGRGPAPPG